MGDGMVLRRRYMPLTVFSVLMGVALPVMANDRVPLRDGFYADTAEKCVEFRKGELDLPPYQVDKGGRLFQGPESACVVASITMIRPPNRYHVKTNCREYEETFDQSFILDTPTREKFSLEGDDYMWCGETHGTLKQAAPEPKTTSKRSDQALIDLWADANDDCRGGSGDDPATKKACDRRSKAVSDLQKRGLCYKSVKGGQDWVRCRN